MSTWILDPGHEGRSPGGLYLRSGKQSPDIPPGIYEGIFNREVCARVERMCTSAGIPCVVTVPGPLNPTLKERVAYCNALHDARGDCLVICVHANAAGADGDWHDAHGVTTFHSQTASDRSIHLASALHDKIVDFCPPLTSRGVKTAAFAMLIKTKCPAAYIECGFMDNLEDATYLASYTGQDQIAAAIFSVILEQNE